MGRVTPILPIHGQVFFTIHPGRRTPNSGTSLRVELTSLYLKTLILFQYSMIATELRAFCAMTSQMLQSDWFKSASDTSKALSASECAQRLARLLAWLRSASSFLTSLRQRAIAYMDLVTPFLIGWSHSHLCRPNGHLGV